MKIRDERGGIITGWLLKLVVSLAIVGVVAFEAGAVVVSRVTTDSLAGDVADEAVSAYGRNHDPAGAEAVARDVATRRDAKLVAISFSADGQTLTLTIEKKAKTIILQRIGATKSWAVARATKRRHVT